MSIQSLEQLEAEVQAIREARRNMTTAAAHAPTMVGRRIEHDRAVALHNRRSATLYAKVVHLIAFHDVDAKAYALAASKVAELLPETP